MKIEKAEGSSVINGKTITDARNPNHQKYKPHQDQWGHDSCISLWVQKEEED